MGRGENTGGEALTSSGEQDGCNDDHHADRQERVDEIDEEDRKKVPETHPLLLFVSDEHLPPEKLPELMDSVPVEDGADERRGAPHDQEDDGEELGEGGAGNDTGIDAKENEQGLERTHGNTSGKREKKFRTNHYFVSNEECGMFIRPSFWQHIILP